MMKDSVMTAPTRTYDFDALSDSDDIPSDATRVFFGGPLQPISKVKLWRERRAGRIPEPNAFGRWNMGECRKAKAALKNRGPRSRNTSAR
jgi:hypothetical protein